MRNINYLLALFLLIFVNVNVVLAANNYKLHAYGNSDSDASALVTAGTYADAATAQKAIYHYDVASPWKFGTYESATQKFFIYTADNATWKDGAQWQTLNDGTSPLVWDGHSFQHNNGFSPVIFFVAPDDAIYKVNTTFEYQSGNGDTQGSTLFQFKANDGSSVVNMNFGANYTANDRTHASDFFVNLHAGDTIAFNQACTVWGDPYCAWTKLEVLGNNDEVAFTSTEANASGFYFDNYVVATDFSYLNAKILASETLIGATVIGTYPASAITAFQSAIDAAKSFVSNQPNATQLEINAQLVTLSTAYTTFANSYIGANNYKLYPYGEAGSDANVLVSTGTYGDVETAQKAIVHNDVASPWKFGTYEFATQEFFIYTADNAYWNGSQWQTAQTDGICPIVYEGHSYVNNANFSPVFFFVAPVAAIYKVNTNFEYQSGNGDTQGSTLFQFKANDGSSVVNMNFGANYTANDRTHASDFFVNLRAGDTIAFNQTCTVWGDPFSQWTKLQVMRDNNGVAYSETDASASGSYFDNYVVATDFSYLNAKIIASETLIGATVLGAYPASAITAFQSAIDAAKNFVSNQPNASQLEVDAQLATLSTASTTFANSYIAANNYKLQAYGDADSDASALVTAGTYPDAATAQKAIYHYDVASPWKFGTYETATQKFFIYTPDNAYWNGGSQWEVLTGGSPIVYEGHTFQSNNGFSPVIFFVAPVAAIYKVNTNFEYQSSNGDTQGSTLFQFKANDGSSVVNMNFGANYTANDRIHASDFFVNLHAGDTITFNQTCTVWGDPFCQWTKLQVMRDNGGVAFTSTDANASGSYFDSSLITTVKNQTEANNMKIINVENGIRLITNKVAPVSIYNIAGVQIKNIIVNSNEVISLAKGAYIVKFGDIIQKVIVR